MPSALFLIIASADLEYKNIINLHSSNLASSSVEVRGELREFFNMSMASKYALFRASVICSLAAKASLVQLSGLVFRLTTSQPDSFFDNFALAHSEYPPLLFLEFHVMQAIELLLFFIKSLNCAELGSVSWLRTACFILLSSVHPDRKTRVSALINNFFM